MPPSHGMAIMLQSWRPRGSTRSLCGRRILKKRYSVWLQWGSSCARTGPWWGACWQITTTFVNSIASPLRPLRQGGARTTTPWRLSHALHATISNLSVTYNDATTIMAIAQRCLGAPVRRWRPNGIVRTTLWCTIGDSLYIWRHGPCI